MADCVGIPIPYVIHLIMNHNQVGKCVTSSIIKFKDAVADLRKDQTTIYHKNSLEENSRFIAVMENKKHSAIMQVNNNISKQIKCNRATFKSILRGYPIILVYNIFRKYCNFKIILYNGIMGYLL